MEKLKKRLLSNYNNIIRELEQIDDLCKTTLAEATSKGDYSEKDIALLAVFARDNHRRLMVEKAERDLINQY